MYPRFLFHETLAREGRLIGSAAAEPTEPGWVDTPEKFNPAYVAPTPVVADDALPADAKAAGYIPQGYPKHLFRKGDVDSLRSVANAAEHADLEAREPGVWKETYDAKAWADAPMPAQTLGTLGSVPTFTTPPEPPPVAPTPFTMPTDEQRAEFYKTTVSAIAEKLSGVGDVAALDILRVVEDANPAGPRVTVLKAIKARTAELAVPDSE